MTYANKKEKRPQKCDRNAQEGAEWSLGRSNAPRGSFRSKCQVKALLHGKMNKAGIKLRKKDEGGDNIPY